MDRDVPIVADQSVDRAFGTGAVKVTPAHDATDLETGKRHGLASIDIMTDEGTINARGAVMPAWTGSWPGRGSSRISPPVGISKLSVHTR